MIKFFSPREQPYGCFSNFHRCQITVDGKMWPTSEHFYQAMKFKDENIREMIRNLKTPREAADTARDKSLPLRHDWEKDDPPTKYKVMLRALFAKFTQHKSLKDLLLSTGDEEIIEDSPWDYIWGIGKDGTGQNLLGKALMETRTAIKLENIKANYQSQ